uniref:WAP domain-containing protein n=1 Tax=Ornithorhynchus anatinus TaxID=9258 RepID=A0A6I8P7P4_ORNAN
DVPAPGLWKSFLLSLGTMTPWSCPIPWEPGDICPRPPPGIEGDCVYYCKGDDSCPPGQKCCSNGCGYVCMTPIKTSEQSGPLGCSVAWWRELSTDRRS